jgi:hypothetical protein
MKSFCERQTKKDFLNKEILDHFIKNIKRYLFLPPYQTLGITYDEWLKIDPNDSSRKQIHLAMGKDILNLNFDLWQRYKAHSPYLDELFEIIIQSNKVFWRNYDENKDKIENLDFNLENQIFVTNYMMKYCLVANYLSNDLIKVVSNHIMSIPQLDFGFYIIYAANIKHEM